MGTVYFIPKFLCHSIWKNTVQLHVLDITSNFISAKVLEFNGVEWHLLLVYRNPCKQRRTNVWEEIYNSCKYSQYSLFMGGDINQVINQADQWGDQEVRDTDGLSLQHLLNKLSLEELQPHGNWFT